MHPRKFVRRIGMEIVNADDCRNEFSEAATVHQVQQMLGGRPQSIRYLLLHQAIGIRGNRTGLLEGSIFGRDISNSFPGRSSTIRCGQGFAPVYSPRRLLARAKMPLKE